MIQLRTMVNVADNSGARKLQCFHVMGGSYRKYASLGDIIVCSVRDALPNGAIKKGDVVKAVVVRAVRNKRRPDGSYISFDDNAACVIDDNIEPKTEKPTRVRIETLPNGDKVRVSVKTGEHIL